MRLRFPLIPVVVHLRFEYTGLASIRPRFSVRTLVVMVGLLGLVLGCYMEMVELPERKRRFYQADHQVSWRIDLLDRAASQGLESDREMRERLGRDFDSIAEEERKAAGYPEGSEQRDLHLLLASQWKAETERVRRRLGPDLEAATAFRSRAEELQARRTRAAGDLAAIEALATDAGNFPSTPAWKRLQLSDRMQELEIQMRSRPKLLSNRPRTKPGIAPR